MSQIVPPALAGQQLLEFYEGLHKHILQGANPVTPHRYLVEMTLADLRARAAREAELLSELKRTAPTELTVEEINAIVTPDTGWEVSVAKSPHDQSEFLRLWRRDADGVRVFLASLPREAGPGVICSFGSVAGHYKRLGASDALPGVDETEPGYSPENPAPCPFCGKKPELDGEDTLYPTGRWREDDGIRHYLFPDDPRPAHGQVYTMHCPETYGGCGAQVSGDSKDAVLGKWNRRSP